MTTAHVLPVLVAFGTRRVAAWERVRRRVGVAVGADRAAAVGGAHRHRGLVCGPRRPAPQALRRRAGQGRAGRAVRPRRADDRGVPGTAGAAAVSRRQAGARTRHRTGRHAMQSATRATGATATGVAARAVDVWKVYGGSQATRVDALAGVTLDLPRGRFTAIMGPSGSGKSTLLHCLAGLDRISGGQVWIGDTRVDTLGDRALTRLRREQVGFVFQLFNLLPTLTAAENITLPLAIGGRKPDRAWLDRIVHTLGLSDRLDHRPAQLSGGEQQRVACARALLSRPQVVFADEPTGNLDSRSSAEVLGFLRRSARELGQTVVMVTHDPTAAAYADRVVFLVDGRIVGELADPTAARVLEQMKHLSERKA